MFIIWGTKVVRKGRGRAADFCIFCRDFEPLDVEEIRSVGHLYYVPLGRATTLGYELTCASCGLVRTLDDPTITPPTTRDKYLDVDGLIEATNPDAREAWSDRLALEGRIRSGSASPEERAGAIFESFLAADAILMRRAGAIHLDAASALGLFAVFFGTAATIMASASLPLKPDDRALVTLAVLGVLLVAFVYLLATDLRRHARRKVLPPLVRSLRPVRPTDEEVESALAALKGGRKKIAKVLRPEWVVAALAEPEA